MAALLHCLFIDHKQEVFPEMISPLFAMQGGVLKTQQLALRRAIAEFHNIVHIRDPPITSQHVDILDQTFILQLYNVRGS